MNQLVRDQMQARRWTQERLAERAGVSVDTLRRVLRGGDVTVSTLRAVAGALGIPVAALLQGDDGPAPPNDVLLGTPGRAKMDSS